MAAPAEGGQASEVASADKAPATASSTAVTELDVTARNHGDDPELSGMGQDSMMAFIKMHFGAILGPFAEQLGDLHQAVALTNEAMAAVQSKDFSEPILDIRDRLGKTGRRVASMEERLASLEEQHKETRGRVQKVSVDFENLDTSHRDTISKVQELRGELVTSRNSVAQLRVGLGEVERRVSKEVQPEMDRQATDIESLKKSQRDAEKTFQEFKKTTSTEQQDLIHRTSALERSRRDDVAILAEATKAIEELRTLAENTHHLTESVREHGLQTRALLPVLKDKCDQAIRAQALQDVEHKEAMQKHKDAMERITRIDSQLQTLHGNVGIDEEGLSGGGTLASRVLGLDALMERKIGEVHDLQHARSVHAHQLGCGERRTAALEEEQAKLQKAAATLRNDVVSIEAMLAVNAEKDAQREAAAEAEERRRFDEEERMRELLKSRMAEKLNQQARELEKTNSMLQRTHEELTARIDRLSGELTTTGSKVEKLHSGLEVTTDYWRGLTRGFRETSEKGDLLPPKGSPLLPAVTKPGAGQPLHSARSLR